MREDWDLRMEQTMVCHMAGFKNMISNEFEKKLPREAKQFRKFGHDLACMSERQSWEKAPKFKIGRRLLRKRAGAVANTPRARKHGCNGHSTSLMLSNLLLMYNVGVH